MLARSAILSCGVFFVAQAIAIVLPSSDASFQSAETLSTKDVFQTEDPITRGSPFCTRPQTAVPTPSFPPGDFSLSFTEPHHTRHPPSRSQPVGGTTVTVTDVVTVTVGASGATTTPPVVGPPVRRIVPLPPPFDTDPCADRAGPTRGIMPLGGEPDGSQDQ